MLKVHEVQIALFDNMGERCTPRQIAKFDSNGYLLEDVVFPAWQSSGGYAVNLALYEKDGKMVQTLELTAQTKISIDVTPIFRKGDIRL